MRVFLSLQTTALNFVRANESLNKSVFQMFLFHLSPFFPNVFFVIFIIIIFIIFIIKSFHSVQKWCYYYFCGNKIRLIPILLIVQSLVSFRLCIFHGSRDRCIFQDSNETKKVPSHQLSRHFQRIRFHFIVFFFFFYSSSDSR